MSVEDFVLKFRHLTDNEPFPWQVRLYRQFIGDQAGGVPLARDRVLIKAVHLARPLASPFDLEKKSVSIQDGQTNHLQSVSSLKECAFDMCKSTIACVSMKNGSIENKELFSLSRCMV